MSELTDDQLDGLFRKSAEEFDPPFDPTAWQEMKTRLDAHDRTMSGGTPIWDKLLRWGLPIALLLLLTGGGWYLSQKTNSPVGSATSPAGTTPRTELNPTAKEGLQRPAPHRLADAKRPAMTSADSPERNVDKGQLSANQVAVADEPQKTENLRAEPATRIGAPTLTNKPDATKSTPSSYRLPSGQKRTSRTRVTGTSLANTTVERATTRLNRISTPTGIAVAQKRRKNSSDGLAFSATNYAIPAGPSFTKRPTRSAQQAMKPDASVVSENTTLPELNEETSLLMPGIAELTIRPGQWAKPLAFTTREVVAQPDTVAKKVTPKPIPMRGISVRFMVSPDLSAIGLKNFTRPGTNVGLMLEYRLASRWSVQAGIIQSTKVYKASADDYGYLPDYLQKYKSNLAGVDGRCNMLDIPINVRYDVALRARPAGLPPSRWFVSGGVTSYIMKQEDYKYTYFHVYPTSRQEESASTGGYGFSQLNLSAGYERALSRRLSWQVEPFLKAPLRGVGYLKINLLSTGAFFSLRYKL